MTVRVVEARPDDGGLEIVVPHDFRHAAEIAERVLVQPQKCLELLIPDRFFVAVARVAQRHPKDPRPTPFAGARLERGRPLEEIHLGFVTMGSFP